MLELQDFLQETPATLLREYFAAKRIDVAQIDWDASGRDRANELQNLVDKLEPVRRNAVLGDAEHIAVLAREDGQAALYSARHDSARLDSLDNGFARATWVFVHDQRWWEHAEQTRYSDERRFSRAWDGFVAPKQMSVARGEEIRKAFEARIATEFRSSNVEVEVCDRTRTEAGGKRTPLVQVAIFFEGRRGSRRAFIEGRLDRQPDMPVLEAAVAYSPATGVLEVVAGQRPMRETLVRLFAETMLGAPISGQRLPIREYTIDHLRAPQSFARDAGDAIEEVAVTLLRLMPLDAPGERVTLECTRSATKAIWQMADERFGDANPLRAGCRVTQVRLRIRFAPQPHGRGRRTLPVLITMPHGCDLKGKTSRERLIGEKYLERWGLLRNV